MFWKIMISAFAILAIGWVAYGIYEYRARLQEKKNPKPKPGTEHLQKVKDSFDDYTKQLESFERKTYKREELE